MSNTNNNTQKSDKPFIIIIIIIHKIKGHSLRRACLQPRWLSARVHQSDSTSLAQLSAAPSPPLHQSPRSARLNYGPRGVRRAALTTIKTGFTFRYDRHKKCTPPAFSTLLCHACQVHNMPCVPGTQHAMSARYLPSTGSTYTPAWSL